MMIVSSSETLFLPNNPSIDNEEFIFDCLYIFFYPISCTIIRSTNRLKCLHRLFWNLIRFRWAIIQLLQQLRWLHGAQPEHSRQHGADKRHFEWRRLLRLPSNLQRCGIGWKYPLGGDA